MDLKGLNIKYALANIRMLLASFIGGWMFTFLDIKLVIGVGVVASVAGTIIMLAALRKMFPRGRQPFGTAIVAERPTTNLT